MKGTFFGRQICCGFGSAAVLIFGITSLASTQAQSSKGLEQTKCNFQDHTSVTVEYSSMKRNGRKIFGEIVPFDKIWATGVKQSPTFLTDADLVVGGQNLPAGHYRFVTIPNPDKWTMIIKKSTGTLDTGEVARIDLIVRPLSPPLEDFTIQFQQSRGGCVFNLRWEETEASVLLAEQNKAPQPK